MAGNDKTITPPTSTSENITQTERDVKILRKSTLNPHTPAFHPLEQRLNSLEQLSRNTNVLITGVPPLILEGRFDRLLEELYKILNLSVEFITGDIDAIYRLNGENLCPPILVQFRTRRIRDMFLGAVKHREQSLGKIRVFHLEFSSGCENSVHFSEHLSPGNAKLFAAARNNPDYKQAWVRGGKIYVKKDDNSGSIRLTL